MNYIIPKILKDLENGLDEKLVKYFYYGIPEMVSDDILTPGAIFVMPSREDITSVATGVTHKVGSSIDIILGINTKVTVYKNAQVDSGMELLNKIMSGKDASGTLKTDTVLYIIRSNMKNYGIRQLDANIVYDDKRVLNEGSVTATLSITQEKTEQIPV